MPCAERHRARAGSGRSGARPTASSPRSAAHHHAPSRRRTAPARRISWGSRRASRPARSCASGSSRYELDAAGAPRRRAWIGVMAPSCRQLAFTSIANPATVACMPASPVCRRAAAARLVGLRTGPPPTAASPTRLRLPSPTAGSRLGTRLPSERELTAALDVCRTTVTRAYAVLRESRLRRASRRGSGTFTTPARRAAASARDRRRCSPATGDGRHRPQLRRHSRAAPASSRPTSGPPSSCPRYLAGPGYFPLGVPELREADRRGATTPAACPPTPEQVHGHRPARWPASAIVPQALVGRGDRVVVESPDLPQRHRRRCAAPAPASCRCRGPRRLGPRRVGRAPLRQTAAAARLPDPRLPQPHRRPDGRRRPRGAGRRAAARRHRAGHRRDHRRGRPRGRPMPLPFAAHDPRAITRRQLVEVALGRPAHRLGARAARPRSHRWSRPGDQRPRGAGARAAGARSS